MAPLAALLFLVGPTPHEANVALAKLWNSFQPSDSAALPDVQEAPTLLTNRPAMRQPSPAFTTSRSNTNANTPFEVSLKR
jgi:hypothetical protein